MSLDNKIVKLDAYRAKRAASPRDERPAAALQKSGTPSALVPWAAIMAIFAVCGAAVVLLP